MDKIKIKRTALYCGHNSDRKRVITIAHTDDKMGISVCNPNDRYSKKIGREIATNRLNKNPLNMPQNLSKLNYEEICVLALTVVKSTMLDSIKGGVV
jgi:hypothetical protein